MIFFQLFLLGTDILSSVIQNWQGPVFKPYGSKPWVKIETIQWLTSDPRVFGGSQMPDKKDGIETLQHCERVYKILYKNQKIFLTHLLEDTNNSKANASTTNTLFNMSTLDFPV